MAPSHWRRPVQSSSGRNTCLGRNAAKAMTRGNPRKYVREHVRQRPLNIFRSPYFPQAFPHTRPTEPAAGRFRFVVRPGCGVSASATAALRERRRSPPNSKSAVIFKLDHSPRNGAPPAANSRDSLRPLGSAPARSAAGDPHTKTIQLRPATRSEEKTAIARCRHNTHRPGQTDPPPPPASNLSPWPAPL